MIEELFHTIETEEDLAALAVSLGAERVRGLSKAEEKLTEWAAPFPSRLLAECRALIHEGYDVLGELFCSLREPVARRERGATYTPDFIVASMLAWAKLQADPERIVDAGTGSGRFLMESGKAFRRADLIGIELDPLAALLARANLAALGLEKRATVLLADYRKLSLPPVDGQTLFVGNPPYVRHHLIDAEWKQWLTESAKKYGYTASQLAGLHVHFFLRTLQLAKPGDRAVFVTAAEWLDVNYGKLVRDLFLNELGGKSIHLIEPTARPFTDAATTAAVTAFEIGSKSVSVRLKRVETVEALGVLAGGRLVSHSRLETARRWGPFFRPSRKAPDGFVELGELCSVHRGAVTGSNRVWIAGEHSKGLPESVLFASVTKARELIQAGTVLSDDSSLRRVIDLPTDLGVFDAEERKAVDTFLKEAKAMGADKGFIAEHRRAWWSVGLRNPAPILSTYMARRAPAFVLNAADARHINIAHGIYPREPMSATAIERLASHLSTSTSIDSGRTYAGGLTKFEPKEMERLLVPTLAALEASV